MCNNTCQFGGALYRAGEILSFPDNLIEKCSECNGDGCGKCRNSGRVVPPHHFKELTKAVKEKKESIEEVKDEKQEIQEELDRLGKPFDKRWGLARLKHALHLAQKGV